VDNAPAIVTMQDVSVIPVLLVTTAILTVKCVVATALALWDCLVTTTVTAAVLTTLWASSATSVHRRGLTSHCVRSVTVILRELLMISFNEEVVEMFPKENCAHVRRR